MCHSDHWKCNWSLCTHGNAFDVYRVVFHNEASNRVGQEQVTTLVSLDKIIVGEVDLIVRRWLKRTDRGSEELHVLGEVASADSLGEPRPHVAHCIGDLAHLGLSRR